MATKRQSADVAAKNRSLHYRATMLRAHIVACKICAGAVKKDAGEACCPKGIILACRVAQAWDMMIDLKKNAGPGENGLIYACPDPALHGEAYHLCAELYNVVAVQEKLF